MEINVDYLVEVMGNKTFSSVTLSESGQLIFDVAKIYDDEHMRMDKSDFPRIISLLKGNYDVEVLIRKNKDGELYTSLPVRMTLAMAMDDAVSLGSETLIQGVLFNFTHEERNYKVHFGEFIPICGYLSSDDAFNLDHIENVTDKTIVGSFLETVGGVWFNAHKPASHMSDSTLQKFKAEWQLTNKYIASYYRPIDGLFVIIQESTDD